jgi:hypothetical protein
VEKTVSSLWEIRITYAKQKNSKLTLSLVVVSKQSVSVAIFPFSS